MADYLSVLQSKLQQLQDTIELAQESSTSKLYTMYYNDREGFDKVIESQKTILIDQLESLQMQLAELES